MKLDENNNPIAYEISKEKEQEIQIGQNDHQYSDLWAGLEDKRQLVQGRNRLLKMIRENKGLDRGMSYNPFQDAIEKAWNSEYKYVVPITKININLKPRVSLWHQFLNWITRSGKLEKKFNEKLFNGRV